jgi:hypothetical protein
MSVRMTFITTSNHLDTTLSQAHKSYHYAIISKIKSTIISSKIHALRYVYLEYCLSPIFFDLKKLFFEQLVFKEIDRI